MSFQRLSQTAEEYWQAFEVYHDNQAHCAHFKRESERLRFLSLLAFTSLDAQVNAFWLIRVLPEWQEVLSLIDNLLKDDSELAKLLELAGPELNRAQMIASLRFIAHSGEPSKFSPTFTDCGLVWLLMSEARAADAKYVRVAKVLFHLQRIRNSCFHTGREFNELKGKEALFLLHEWKEIAPSMHPAFEAPLKYDLDAPEVKAA